MGPEMQTIEQVEQSLAAGKTLLLAGDQQLLSALPAGNWVGGTTACFLSGGMGLASRERLFVTELPDYACISRVKTYDATTISQIYREAPANGFSFIIIPYRSQTHLTFATDVSRFEDFPLRPLIGWIAGKPLQAPDILTPKVFDGKNPAALAEGAVVMHVELPADKVAEIGMINPFEQGDGDRIRFPASGFSTREAEINGVRTDFASYLHDRQLDQRMPLVAEHAGAMINTTFRSTADGEVRFFNAVFDFLEYRHARPVDNYAAHFAGKVRSGQGVQTLFSCNCILNYLHADLEGRRIDCPSGPTTFGEIAYQTQNQTVVYLRIIDLINRLSF